MVIVVSGVVVIVVIALASSSLLFFTFIVIIAPSPHNVIPPLPSDLWLEGAVVVGSIHDNRIKIAILVETMMTPAHVDCRGQCQHHLIGVVLVLEMSGIVVAVDIACRFPVTSPCPLPPPFSLCRPPRIHPSSQPSSSSSRAALWKVT
jgi:hypothetical protein